LCHLASQKKPRDRKLKQLCHKLILCWVCCRNLRLKWNHGGIRKKSNSIDAKFFLFVCVLSSLNLKPDFRYSSLSFFRLSWGRPINKLATKWQNFARVGLQLKFAFKIWLSVWNSSWKSLPVMLFLLSRSERTLNKFWIMNSQYNIPSNCFGYEYPKFAYPKKKCW